MTSVSIEQQPILDREAHDKLQAILARDDARDIFDPVQRSADPALEALYLEVLDLGHFAAGAGFPTPEDEIEVPIAA